MLNPFASRLLAVEGCGHPLRRRQRHHSSDRHVSLHGDRLPIWRARRVPSKRRAAPRASMSASICIEYSNP
jgi:hypothetical protein